MTERWPHGSRLQRALGTLQQTSWRGSTMTVLMLHYKSYLDAVTDVLERAVGDARDADEERFAAEMTALEEGDDGS